VTPLCCPFDRLRTSRGVEGLPPDLRDWVPAVHPVNSLIDAVAKLDLQPIQVNTRGTGDAQYRPTMSLAPLVYSDATGVFGSKRIKAIEP
jgi:hypothetical protein